MVMFIVIEQRDVHRRAVVKVPSLAVDSGHVFSNKTIDRNCNLTSVNYCRDFVSLYYCHNQSFVLYFHHAHYKGICLCICVGTSQINPSINSCFVL